MTKRKQYIRSMKMDYIIVDDEPLAHQVVIDYAKDVEYLNRVGQYYRPLEAVAAINAGGVDLVFLDIQMPKLTGIELLRLIKTTPQIILTTAYGEYAVESYELQVCDYLLKPFRFDRFLQATEKASSQYASADAHSTDNGSLFIKVDKKLIKVDKKDIIFIESYGNYIKVWLEDLFLLTLNTLNGFNEGLDQSKFLQVHKSFIINVDHMSHLEGNTVTMTNGAQVSLSKSFKKKFFESISKG